MNYSRYLTYGTYACETQLPYRWLQGQLLRLVIKTEPAWNSRQRAKLSIS